MPPVEEVVDAEKQAPGAKPLIGIIYPPPEVRNIVDKTASFVARNGPEFETRIRQNELNNPKFNFLNTTDPYYAYYQHKVKEFKEGKGQEPAAPLPKSGLGLAPAKPILEQQAKLIETSFPKEAPPEPEYIADPPSISSFDLDVVKLTAQFVARNGRQFLTNLMNREQRNYQFDFLRPQHNLFNYFTKLVEQYTKILIPPKDLLPKLKKECENPRVVLNEVKYRVEWAKHQEREKIREEEAKEKERVAYASVDWHDFVVVETVDFQPNEQGTLPPPTTPEEVGARILAQERFEGTPADAVEMDVDSDEEGETPAAAKRAPAAHHGDDTQVQDMEESGSEDEDDEPPSREQRYGDERDLPPGTTRQTAPPPPPPLPKDPQPPPLPPMPDQVTIKHYDPKSKTFDLTPGEDKMVISPFTGEKIPADKIQEHVRIYLLDPNYIEKQAPEKRISAAKGDEEVYASGSSIGSSLKQLAARRTDIFGVGSEETQIGKMIGEEEKHEKSRVIWDGHTASMEKVTQKARENISIEEQIAVIHKAKGLLHDEEKEKIGPSAGPTPTAPPPAAPVAPKPPPPVSSAPSVPVKPPAPKTTAPSVPVAAPRPPVAVPAPPQPPQMMVIPPQPPMPPGAAPVVGIPVRPPMPPVMPPGIGVPYMPGPPVPPGAAPRPVSQQTGQTATKRPGGEEEGATTTKKAKTEENLIPEQQFLGQHAAKGPVQFRVSVPNVPEKPEWHLNGQVLTFTLPLTDNVSVIKAMLHESLGMAAGKQKLQLEGLFMKDANTLAFYNFTPNCTVQLQVKERGGRKK